MVKTNWTISINEEDETINIAIHPNLLYHGSKVPEHVGDTLNVSYEGRSFTIEEALQFSREVNKWTSELEVRLARKRQQEAFAKNASVPVDRNDRVLVGNKPVTEDHRDINPSTGMQKDYVVLSPFERSKGFIRSYRTSYIHTVCGGMTHMHREIAETYARDPKFYSGTYCSRCRNHFPLKEFVWEGTSETVGS